MHPPEMREPTLDPTLPIIDAHHHLWRDNPFLAEYALSYGPEDLARDARGHNIVGTVYVEAHVEFRSEGPEKLRPVGETAFAAAQASRVGTAEICAGIIAYADLMLGSAVTEVLDAHAEAGRGRLRGIRNSVTHVSDTAVPAAYSLAPARRLSDATFVAGAAQLSRRNLVFETWLFQGQLAELAQFADALPDLTIVLDHIGGYLNVGSYAERRTEAFDSWRAGLQELARRPNVLLKIGGMGMRVISPQLQGQRDATSSETMAAAWRPMFETCVESFGADRCMLESNYPIDRPAASYHNIWNAFKRLTRSASAGERSALFSGTARKAYRLVGIC